MNKMHVTLLKAISKTKNVFIVNSVLETDMQYPFQGQEAGPLKFMCVR